MDKNLTDKLRQFLETPNEQKDWNAGAILLLQLTNNPIMYRNISLNPKGKADFILGKLQQFLKARCEIENHNEVMSLQSTVNEIVTQRTEFSNPDTNPATDFKAGKRADHDTLPEDIQALYVENLDIVHRMRELHLQLRKLSDSTKTIPDSERKPLLDEFIALDKKLHDNWNTYDHYVANAEKEEQKAAVQEEQSEESEVEQGDDSEEEKSKAKSKKSKAKVEEIAQ